GAGGVAREAETVDVDDVDVAGARREPVLQGASPFVGERRRDPRDDLLVLDLAARHAALRSFLGRQLIDQRIGRAIAAPPRIVFVPAGAGLLAVASHLVETIGNRRLRSFGARFANRRQVLPDARADIDAGDVLHAERADRQAEVAEHAIDLLDACALLEQEV